MKKELKSKEMNKHKLIQIKYKYAEHFNCPIALIDKRSFYCRWRFTNCKTS